jgi:hypothetical protein
MLNVMNLNTNGAKLVLSTQLFASILETSAQILLALNYFMTVAFLQMDKHLVIQNAL